MLYNNLSGYFRSKYGKRLGKICIDGGFSCPNRDGKCGSDGCIYCGERGAGEHIDPKTSISEQVMTALQEAGDDELFVAYFQNFTNTYAPVEILKERYDAALIDERIKILAVLTRQSSTVLTKKSQGLSHHIKKRLTYGLSLDYKPQAIRPPN